MAMKDNGLIPEVKYFQRIRSLRFARWYDIRDDISYHVNKEKDLGDTDTNHYLRRLACEVSFLVMLSLCSSYDVLPHFSSALGVCGGGGGGGAMRVAGLLVSCRVM